MTLQQIETIVLVNIGYDRYSALSVDTNSEKIEDFSILHNCVNLAREEIKLNTTMPALIRFGTAIAVASGVAQYSLPIDFDVPVNFYLSETATITGTKLTQRYAAELPENLALTSQATPDSYFIVGTSGNLAQIYLVSTPNAAGFILPVYKPVLTTLTTSTDEDIIMRKYPKTVINFATAFAFQLLKKDSTNHDKFYGIGISECAKIDLRETQADSSFRELPNQTIQNRRGRRLTR